jgi:hypothetical protein
LSGLVAGSSFGVVDPGGDKTSDRYRGGMVASYIPLSPTGAVKDVLKGGGRLAAHEGERVAVREAERSVVSHAYEPGVWKPVIVDGKKVYQRDDLIDPLKKDDLGRTNLERMAKGKPALGPDGEAINLHHTIQTNDGPIAEVAATLHIGERRALHVNWPPGDFPSGIDRPEFEAWRKRYWKRRGIDFPEGPP